MNNVGRFVVLGGMPLALLTLGAVIMLPSVVPPPEPQRVTSDTPEYCLHLFDQVSELVRAAPAPLPAQVSSLSAEGQHMCERGQTRAANAAWQPVAIFGQRRRKRQYSGERPCRNALAS